MYVKGDDNMAMFPRLMPNYIDDVFDDLPKVEDASIIKPNLTSGTVVRPNDNDYNIYNSIPNVIDNVKEEPSNNYDDIARNVGYPNSYTVSEAGELDKILKEAKECIENREFAEGSMLPKIEACMEFVKHSKGKKAIITSLAKAKFAIEGKTGTTIEGGQ